MTQYAPRTIEEKTKGEIQKSMVDLLSFMDKVTPRYMYYDQILYLLYKYWEYSPKSYVVNFCTQISSSQSEEWTIVFTREKKWYVQSESQTMFFHMWEKWYVQSEATEMCEFRAKIPAFYCSLQRCFAHIQR